MWGVLEIIWFNLVLEGGLPPTLGQALSSQVLKASVEEAPTALPGNPFLAALHYGKAVPHLQPQPPKVKLMPPAIL